MKRTRLSAFALRPSKKIASIYVLPMHSTQGEKKLRLGAAF
jgi:hypothetical protein